MRWLRWAVAAAGTGALVLALIGTRPVPAQQVLQHGFETRDPIWVQGPSDAAFKEVIHELTDETAHTGHRSEHIRLQVDQGNFIHYTYDVGRAPVNEELNVTLWVKANRPGVRLLCRVVLPRERDPHDAGKPLTVLVPGEDYKLVGRWQQLSLPQPVKRLREQQQLLRVQLRRDVITADAYIDRLVIDLYSGSGLTDVWTDDLEVGPVLDPRPAPWGGRDPVPARPGATRRAAVVQLRGGPLVVSGQRFSLLGIRHTGTPLKTLRDAGFNTVWLDE